MSTHILKESDWENFIQKEILPIITRPRNKFGVTSTLSGATNTSSEVTNAVVFALVGDLGVGKTTFSKIFLKKLGIKQHIQSPTFSIINSYNITGSPIKSGMTGEELKKIFHIDVYRIDDIKELEVLHIDEILSNPEHIVVIEWADKMRAHIPQNAYWIYFEHDTLETRKVTINGETPKQVRGDKHFVRNDEHFAQDDKHFDQN